MKQKALEYLLVFSLGTILTGLGGFFSGYMQVAKAAKAFFPAGLTKLEVSIESATAHAVEIQALMLRLNTLTGYCEVFQTDRTGVAMVSSRTPFRNKDVVTVTNISGDDGRSTDVTIIGSYMAKDDVLLKVSPDVGKLLGMPAEGKMRAEVKPAK